MNKFLRLNLPVTSHDDILIQQVFASRGNYGDVFFIISDAEHSKEILEVAQTAKNNGSTVISLIPSNSPLANRSSLSLFVDIFEFSKQHVPLSFRIEQLVILDVLSTGVALCYRKMIDLCYKS